MYSAITVIHSSPMTSRRGSTKCDDGALCPVAPMMPETIKPQICDVFDAA